MMRIFLLSILFFPHISWALDYFWVGGSGNWSELRHWVTTSGGNVFHDQIPTAADHVIFDENSFAGMGNRINLDLDNIFCNNLDFRNIARDLVLTGSDRTSLNIFGSLFMHGDVTLDFSGPFNFRGNSNDHEISFAGQVPVQLRFLSAGTWTVKEDLRVDSLIHIEFGSLIFETITIQCLRFQVISTIGVDLDFGDAEILITGNRFLQLPFYRWWESLHFEGPVNTNPGNSRITLPHASASIGFYNLNQIALGQVTIGQFGGFNLISANLTGTFSFEKLHLRGDTRLEGGFQMKDLELDGGNIYTFQSNFDQQVGVFSTNTDCAMVCHLRSSQGGIPATIRALQGEQTVHHVLLQDIQIADAMYTADEVVDLGGNSGWTMNHKNQETFFWIGGTGNWSDTGHWSFSSGGSPSGCLPTAADDVIFDNASFTGPNQQVTIDVPSAFCHTMDWRMSNQNAIIQHMPGKPNLSLHIFGSLYFSPQIRNEFDGDVFFESFHTGNEIESAGHEFVKNVYFSSALGEWTLIDKLDVNDSLYFNSGSLITNDQELECFQFYSETNSIRKLVLGNSVFRIVPSPQNIYIASVFRVNTANFTIDPGTSTVIAEHQIYMNFYGVSDMNLYRVIFEGHSGINVEQSMVNFKYSYFYHDGDIRGEISIDTLTLSPAKAYWLYMNSQINVDSMSSHGNCDGTIFIAAYPKGIQAKIHKRSGTLNISNNILEGIIGEGGATFIAERSQDLGYNQGWTFMDAAPRILYWVGGEGDWFDRQHWSLNSGGMGGECVPTAIDDVFFDQQSFSGSYQNINLTGSNAPICHDFTWTDAPDFTGINNGVLNVTGSLYLQPNVSYFPWYTTFRSDSSGNKIHSGGNQMHWIDMMGNGSWDLMDDIHIPHQINLWSGTFNTNDFDLRTGHLFMGNYPVDFKRKLILGNSHLIFDPGPSWEEQVYINSNNFEIDPGNSLSEFTGEIAGIKHYGSATLHLHNVLFSNIQGQSSIEEYEQANFDFNKLEFYNNGLILNSNEMDTLLLASGKLYKLEFNKTQTVFNHLRAIGNNCTPIGLESTEPGQRSTIFSNDATVIGDFIQMRDQTAAGGAHFSAGAHSTDISNNTGWIFEESPDFIEIGFLGPDRALCLDSVVALSAYNFSPQEAYLWNNAHSGPELQVNTPGVYWAQVTFRDNCVIRDSISIRDPLSLQVYLGSDSTLCEGETHELQGDIDFYGAQYQWQDNSSGTEFLVSSPGEYTLNVLADGCIFSDTIAIEYNPLPVASIRGLREVCEGDTLLLNAELDNASYRWNDGSMQKELTVTRDGTYFVELSLLNCLASDSVVVDFFPVPNVTLGADTILCEEEPLLLSVPEEDFEFTWSDGSRSKELSVRGPGLYWIEARLAHCSMRDTIHVDFKPKPFLPALNDSALCRGTEWLIVLEETDASYRWNTGPTSGTLRIDNPGDYQVTALLNGCERTASFSVDFEPPPTLELGPDLERCEGEEVILNLSQAGVTYYWQDRPLTDRININGSGVYTITANKLNCFAEDSITVMFYPIPAFSLGPERYICPGESFIIEPDKTFAQLTWNDGNNEAMYAGTQPGVYWLEAEENNCFFRDTTEIKHYPLPEINLGSDTIVCHDKILKLNAWHPNVRSYRWQDGSIDPQIVVNEPGLYSLHVDDGRCEAEFDIEVQFRQCQYFSMYIPNAFSPNSDGLNDEFKPFINPSVQIENYLFEIYSRWGEKLYSTTNPDEGWNGTFRGQQYTGDVFVTRVIGEYHDDEGRGKFEEAGSVMLLR